MVGRHHFKFTCRLLALVGMASGGSLACSVDMKRICGGVMQKLEEVGVNRILLELFGLI